MVKAYLSEMVNTVEHLKVFKCLFNGIFETLETEEHIAPLSKYAVIGGVQNARAPATRRFVS